MLPAYDLIGQQFTIILCPNDYYSDCDVCLGAGIQRDCEKLFETSARGGESERTFR